MIKIIGSPSINNSINKEIIKKTIIDKKYLKSKDTFREEIISLIKSDMNVLDIGKSMRNNYDKINCNEKYTLDINRFENYPDFHFDLSEKIKIEETELYNRFDVILCIAVLEHVYDPFVAINNLKKMLKKDGIIYGYVPFLYQYHAPENLEFQDFYRFSKDGLAYLFRDFQSTTLYPVRGRLSSAMHVLFGSLWKKSFEKYGLNIFIDKFFSQKKNSIQSGGYNFKLIK